MIMKFVSKWLDRSIIHSEMKRRAALAESLLEQFIQSAVRIPDGDVQKQQPIYQVSISADMMRDLRMWQRAKKANFKGAAASVLKGRLS